MSPASLPVRAGAECAGTFGLVLIGTGSVVLNDALDGRLGVGGIALAFGLAVCSMILVFGRISGAHINPAVSIALWSKGDLRADELRLYLLAQVLGAILASLLLRLLDPGHPGLGGTQPGIGTAATFALELGLSFALMGGILLAKRVHILLRLSPAVFLGGIVALEAWQAGPATGASMNPARSLGPMVVSGDLRWWWLYLLAPALGMLLAVLLERGLRALRSPQAPRG